MRAKLTKLTVLTKLAVLNVVGIPARRDVPRLRSARRADGTRSVPTTLVLTSLSPPVRTLLALPSSLAKTRRIDNQSSICAAKLPN
jgi:hypothetical protein